MDYSRPPASPLATPRRSFTAPTPRTPQRSSSQDGSGGVETLYNHPSVKIVSFTAGPRSLPLTPANEASPVEIKPGSLQWSSQLERTIAVGMWWTVVLLSLIHLLTVRRQALSESIVPQDLWLS